MTTFPTTPKAKIFDPLKHSFNPLKNIDRKTARELAEVLYTTSAQGENTLTVRNGRRALAQALSAGTRFDKLNVRSDIKGVKEEVEGMLAELLFTDVVRNAVCSQNDFPFIGRNTNVFARINRAELGNSTRSCLASSSSRISRGNSSFLISGSTAATSTHLSSGRTA
jgi:hypothetical protein